MGNKKELLLVHSSMDNVTLTERVNILLSPQFYTLKKEPLPVKYAYQAKKIAPSLFDGLLDDEGNYDYVLTQVEDGWQFIAYDIANITAFLQSKGISQSNVGKIFFAQESIDSFTSPLALNDKEVLTVIEDTVVLVPRSALPVDEVTTLKIDSIAIPKGGVSLKSTPSETASVEDKQVWTIAAILMLFAGILAVEASRYGGDSQEAEQQLASMYETYPVLQSSYTREGIIDKYRTIDISERKKRETIKAFSKMIFKDVVLTSLYVDEKKYKASFSCATKDVSTKVKGLAKKAKLIAKNVKNSNDLTIEGTL